MSVAVKEKPVGFRAKLNKRSAAISKLTDAVEDDLDIETEVREIKEQMAKRLTSLISDCQSLGIQWRRVVEIVCGAVRSGALSNYREIAQLVKPLMNRTSEIYHSVDDTVNECRSVLITSQPLDTLKAEIDELDNIKRWISGWPSHSADEREAARGSIDPTSFLSDNEIERELQSAS